MLDSYGLDTDWGALASLLWNQRDALDALLYRLVQQRLLLTAGETRWLHHADAELSAAVEAMRAGEILRAAELDRFVAALGLSVDTTLGELAGLAPAPWDQVLADHRLVLRALVAEIEAATVQVRALLHAGSSAIRETLDLLTDSTATYTADGAAGALHRGGLLLDAQA